MLQNIEAICMALVSIILPLIGLRLIFDYIRTILFRD